MKNFSGPIVIIIIWLVYFLFSSYQLGKIAPISQVKSIRSSAISGNMSKEFIAKITPGITLGKIARYRKEILLSVHLGKLATLKSKKHAIKLANKSGISLKLKLSDNISNRALISLQQRALVGASNWQQLKWYIIKYLAYVCGLIGLLIIGASLILFYVENSRGFLYL